MLVNSKKMLTPLLNSIIMSVDNIKGGDCMATQKLDKDGKKILDNMKKALPKLTKQQKKNLVKGTEFLVSFTEYSDSSSGSATVT